MLACRGRGERLWRWLHPLRVTQQCRLASVAAWLSSTGISHHHLLPHIPPIRLSTVNGSPRPGTAPQCLNFSSQAPGLQETRAPARLMCGCCKDYPLLIPFRLPRISCFTLSLKCSSSDSDNCPAVGIRPLPQFPDSPWAGPVLPTLPLPPPRSFAPPSYVWFCVYSFPLLRPSWWLSAGALHARRCRELYS